MPSPAYPGLYQRFYANDVPLVPGASSHWRECARRFVVHPTAAGDFDISGSGFGTSDSSSISSRVSSHIANAIHSSYLDIAGLEADIRWAKPIVQRMGLHFSQDAFRQVCTINLATRYLSSNQPPKHIWVIGDGHGILGALLHARFPDAQVCLIDLGAVLFFQAYHLHRAFPGAIQAVTDEHSDPGDAAFQFCPAESVESLPASTVDIAFNVASMQEMDPSVILNYFSILRQHRTRLFYCCNRLEKRMPGGEVTRFMEYPWSDNDEHLVDELCPWHQWFFGYASSPHVRAWGIPLPFMHRFAGLQWHRLTVLAKAT